MKTSKSYNSRKRAVSNVIFSAAVVVLIVAAAAGFGLYGTAVSKTVTTQSTVTVVSTEVMTTEMMTSSSMNHTSSSMSSTSNYSYQFNGTSGAMISSAWLLDVPVGMHEYAVSVHAEGLEANGTYILEGQLINGSMATVPISTQSMTMNTTSASEFQASSSGTGNYWIVLDSCPSTTFESVSLIFLPGMEMTNATTVATIHFSAMMSTTESMMTTTT